MHKRPSLDRELPVFLTITMSIECSDGLNGAFVEVPLDPDLPTGWRQKVYILNGILMPRWTIWYDMYGNKFVNKFRIKQMLGTEDHEEEDTNSNISGGYTLKQNEPPDNNYSAEKNEVSELEEEEDIVDVKDASDVPCLNEEIITPFQTQEEEDQNAVVDTKDILERYRYVIKEEEIGTRTKIRGKTFSGTKSVKKHMNGT